MWSNFNVGINYSRKKSCDRWHQFRPTKRGTANALDRVLGWPKYSWTHSRYGRWLVFLPSIKTGRGGESLVVGEDEEEGRVQFIFWSNPQLWKALPLCALSLFLSMRWRMRNDQLARVTSSHVEVDLSIHNEYSTSLGKDENVFGSTCTER